MNRDIQLVNNSDKDLTIFENKKIRKVIYNEEWYYSIVDVVEILTDSKDSNAYWRKLKQRLNNEESESVTNCHELKLPSKKDGKMYKTDCVNRETILLI